MKISFIGYGNVGAPLADHLQRAGHEVTIAASDAGSESLKKLLARNANLKPVPIAQAVESADVVFLATPFAANEGILAGVKDLLAGKILIDCTNPVGRGLTHGLGSVESGAEHIQKLVPNAKVIKAFNIYGAENLENNQYPGYGVKPAMMYCGNDVEAKKTAGELITQLGWEPVDVGGLEQALHLEHMMLLWVRLVRAKGHSPNIVWAALRR